MKIEIEVNEAEANAIRSGFLDCYVIDRSIPNSSR